MTAASATPKIGVYGVAKHFRWEKRGRKHDVVALRDVEFEVRPGEFLSVIGPSGCGKTTLLRILAGVIHPDAGEVRVDDRVVDGPGPERAMVFQQFGLFPWKTVLENVKFPLLIRKMSDAEATRVAQRHLELVGLSAFKDSHPHQLSGGMQQRVGLARALATDPEILLMDEPFGAIDAQTRQYMQEELLRLWSGSRMSERGSGQAFGPRKTVVFITHDIDEAVLMSDRVLVLTRGPGRVRASIDVELPRPRWEYDVRAHPRFAEVRRLIWDMLKQDLAPESAGAQAGSAGR